MVDPPGRDATFEVGNTDQLTNNGQKKLEEEQSQEQSIATVPQFVDEEFTLIHLNDDCLRAILRYLPFYHLNKIASTCTRLQYIARLVFAQLYNNNRLTYKNLKIMFHENEIRNFGSLAKRMWLHDCKVYHLRLMTEEKCYETLRRLVLSNLHYDFQCIPGDIESIFENLEELSFFHCSSLITMPFDHCTSLTRLECVGRFFKIENVFPKLKYLRYEYSEDHDNGCRTCIKFLLKNHKNLTEVICQKYNSGITEMKELEKLVIRELDNECCKVHELQRLNKLKVLELGIDIETAKNRMRKFLQAVPNPEILVELRLPRLRLGSNDSFYALFQCIGRFSELLILKLDLTDARAHELHHFHSLKKLQQFKLKAARFLSTDALIECIGHMEALKTISFYNVNETNLLLDTTNQVDIRLQQMYLSRQQQLTIKYLKAPPNNIVATEDYTEDLFELCRPQNSYYLYRSIVLNVNSHS